MSTTSYNADLRSAIGAWLNRSVQSSDIAYADAKRSKQVLEDI
jgi:hypothetical protein